MGKAFAWASTPIQGRAYSLWISWVSVHALGALLALAVVPQIPMVNETNTSSLLVSGIVCFLLVSMLQDAILAYHVPGLRFGKWSALTVTSGVAAGSMGGSVLSLVPWNTTTKGGALIAETPSAIERVLIVTIIGVVAGVVIGAAQSLILSESAAWRGGRLSQRSIWVLSSAVAWFLSFGTIAWIVRFLGNHNPNNIYDIGVATMALALVSGITIIGSITAIALVRLFVVFQDDSGTSSSKPARVATVGIGILYAIAAITGAFFLWYGYTFAEESFLWPYSYSGPPYSGPDYYVPPDEFFLKARVLTGGMVVISASYTLLFSILSLKAFRKRHLNVKQYRTRYWAMILSASIVLVFFNLFAFLTWLNAYTD